MQPEDLFKMPIYFTTYTAMYKLLHVHRGPEFWLF